MPRSPSPAEPAARAAAIAALLAAAFAESLALRAMSRLAIAQAGVAILPAVAWLIALAERPALAPAAIGLAGLFVLAMLSLSRDRHLHRLMAAELEVQRLAGIEDHLQERIGTLEMELARSSSALDMARAEVSVHGARDRAGEELRHVQHSADLERRSLELAREAVTDPLTMLPNRKGINEHLIELLAPMERPGNENELALLFLDLDKFRTSTTSTATSPATTCSRWWPSGCASACRARPSRARWGGDEFIVVLPGLGRVEQVRMVAEDLPGTERADPPGGRHRARGLQRGHRAGALPRPHARDADHRRRPGRLRRQGRAGTACACSTW